MKKVILFLADGFEEIEALTVVDVLRRAGIGCDTVSISEDLEVNGAHNIKVIADIKASDVKSKYDGVILPGGMPGTRNLQSSTCVLNTLKQYYEDGRLIGAICAAPIVLSSAGIVKGRKVTSYPGFEKELKEVCYIEEIVVKDDNIITSRGAGTAFDFAVAIMNYLGYEKQGKELKSLMIYHR